jgi:hypothetical protein
MPQTAAPSRGLAPAKGIEARAQGRIAGGQHGHGKERCIGSTRRTNGESSDWHAPGHLHDAVEGIDTRQMLAGHRNAQHRHGGLGREHAGQMGRAAGARDEGNQAAACGRLGVGEHVIGHSVGR